MKEKIVIAFGGKSVEHDISVLTAMQALTALKIKYELYPMYITKDGEAFIDKSLRCVLDVVNFKKKNKNKVKFILSEGKLCFNKTFLKDVTVLNCLHGGLGENGSFSGLLDMCEISHTSSSALGGSISMSKFHQKAMAKECGVEVLPCQFFQSKKLVETDKILEQFGEVVIKPNNLGSSIGINSAKDEKSLKEGLNLAFSFSDSVIVEKKAQNFYELNISLLKCDNKIIFSSIEKPKKTCDLLTFEDKYVSGQKNEQGMKNLFREMPAKISTEMESKVKDYAQKLYNALELFGVCRFDFIVEDGVVFFNEVNTVPGSLAFYLFEDVGIPFIELLDRMILEGKNRKKKRSMLIDKIDTKILTR